MMRFQLLNLAGMIPKLAHQTPLQIMNNLYPWYDSNWLYTYTQAKDLVKRKNPGQLQRFNEIFKPLRTHSDFSVIKLDQVLDDNSHEEILSMIGTLMTTQMEPHELFQFGRMVIHNHDYFNEFQKTLINLVSNAVGEVVEPFYNFLSLYNNLGICEVHMDTPEAKWTLDICIEQSDVWPIYFSQVKDWPENFNHSGNDWQERIKDNPENKFSRFDLHPKDGIIFSGSSQWHYRERISQTHKNNYCHLIFFHFIPEGTRKLVDPRHWANLCDIPELADIGLQYHKHHTVTLPNNTSD